MHCAKESTTALAVADLSITYWKQMKCTTLSTLWERAVWFPVIDGSTCRTVFMPSAPKAPAATCCTFGGHLGLSAGHSGPLLPQSVPLRRTSDRVDPQLTLPHLLRGLNWYSSCVGGLVSYRRSNRLKTFWVTDVTLGFFIEPIPLIVKWIQFYF